VLAWLKSNVHSQQTDTVKCVQNVGSSSPSKFAMSAMALQRKDLFQFSGKK